MSRLLTKLQAFSVFPDRGHFNMSPHGNMSQKQTGWYQHLLRAGQWQDSCVWEGDVNRWVERLKKKCWNEEIALKTIDCSWWSYNWLWRKRRLCRRKMMLRCFPSWEYWRVALTGWRSEQGWATGTVERKCKVTETSESSGPVKQKH